MTTYKVVGSPLGPYYGLTCNNMAIPFDPANTDYQIFKSQINAGEAQLEDADGVLMSPEEAKAFVATLP